MSSDFLTALGNLHAGWRSSAQSGSQVSVALRPLSWTPGLQQLPRLVVEVVVQAPRPEAVGEIVPPEPIPAARYCEHSVHVPGTCQVLQLEDRAAPDAHVHAGRVPVWPRRCILQQLQAGGIPKASAEVHVPIRTPHGLMNPRSATYPTTLSSTPEVPPVRVGRGACNLCTPVKPSGFRGCHIAT